MAEKKQTQQEIEAISQDLLDNELKKELEGKTQREIDKIMKDKERLKESIASWVPKTKLGKEVKSGKIKDLDEILNSNRKILEAEIVDSLINARSDLISIGQSKGKFGGGKRRAWRQTQRKTKEGNVPTFSTMAVIGDREGHLGVAEGKGKETLPARDKAIRKAKLNIIKVIRGDGGFDSVGGGNSSIPFKIEGKSGSVKVVFMPAAPGTGLVAAEEIKKILRMAGIKDIYSRTDGRKRTTFNLAKATMDALRKTNPKYKGKKK